MIGGAAGTIVGEIEDKGIGVCVVKTIGTTEGVD
jgi:hypothetical protein